VGRHRPQPTQRRFRRRLVRVLVDFHADGAPRCEYATTLGAGGMFIETDAPLPPATVLRLRFRLPGSTELHAITARVTWIHRSSQAAAGDVRPAGMGVAFTDAAASARLAHELERLDEDLG
jgi:uncharacterized protein (TIGR02266 family)